jgi:hypothetical protein
MWSAEATWKRWLRLFALAAILGFAGPDFGLEHKFGGFAANGIRTELARDDR